MHSNLDHRRKEGRERNFRREQRGHVVWAESGLEGLELIFFSFARPMESRWNAGFLPDVVIGCMARFETRSLGGDRVGGLVLI